MAMEIKFTPHGITLEDSVKLTRSVLVIALLAFGYQIWRLVSVAGDWRMIALFSTFCAFFLWAIACVPQSSVEFDSDRSTVRVRRQYLFWVKVETINFASIRDVRALESRWGGEGTPTWETWLILQRERKVKLSLVGQNAESARQCARNIEKLIWPNGRPTSFVNA